MPTFAAFRQGRLLKGRLNVGREAPHRRADAKSTKRDQRQDEVTESIADQTRQMAACIRGLPREVVASFACVDPVARAAKVQEVANRISVGMLPVIGWLERRRPVETANLVKARLYLALNEAVTCALLEIPEYGGGKITSHEDEPSKGACRTAKLNAITHAFEENLQGWANDIETEERQRLITESGTQAKSNSVRKKVNPPKIPDRYKAVVKLWPRFKRETKGRPLIRRFREWLKKQQPPISLDSHFENWWNNIYSRQLRGR